MISTGDLLRSIGTAGETFNELAARLRERTAVSRLTEFAGARRLPDAAWFDMGVDAELRNGRSLAWVLEVRAPEDDASGVISGSVQLTTDDGQDDLFVMAPRSVQDIRDFAVAVEEVARELCRAEEESWFA